MDIPGLAPVFAPPPATDLDTAAPTGGPALSQAAARFAELMAADGAAPPTAALALPPAAVDGSAAGTLGDAILGNMRQLSTEFSGKWQQVQALVNSEAASIQDLLRMQLSMAQVSVQYELVGKAISKSTQNLDQLVKLQ